VPDTIYFSPERSDRANVFAPLFKGRTVTDIADRIVRTPRTIGRLITGGPVEPGRFNPYETRPVGGESPVPAAPVVLPMWAADP
jgi:hypothetical protein